jgi:RHS repeat-associated protein
LVLPLAAKNRQGRPVMAGTYPDQNTRPALRPAGRETASGIFLRNHPKRTRKILRKSRISRLVARPAATKVASGVRYYGLRYYNPSTGRWPSRDPIQELGNINIYAFPENNVIGNIDFLGLQNASSISNSSVTIPVKYFEMLAKGWMLPDNANLSQILRWGCVGITMAAQGQDDPNKAIKPPLFGDTSCYVSRIMAEMRKCDKCQDKVVFAVAGYRYKNGKTPKMDPKDFSIPKDSIEFKHYEQDGKTYESFNYITQRYINGEKIYIWATNGNDSNNPNWKGMQVIMAGEEKFDRFLENSDETTMWCTTCTNKKVGGP